MKSVAVVAALTKSEFSEASAGASGAIFLSTWPHGKPANEEAAEVFGSTGNLLDAVEHGINVTENDPTITSVGYGGLPNAEGIVELDAAMMDGTRHHAGAVASLRNIKNPISVARQVLEKTTHTTLAGDGAFQFALKMGFHAEQLLTPVSLKAWMDWKANPKHQTYWKLSAENHDTIGMVAMDAHGRMVSGCSTSGAAWKIPGRVGDSPLIGCGVYADDNVGAASATGDGDLMTNYCTSISIVHYMARGMTPQAACKELMKHMAHTDPRNKSADACVIAMNNKGEVGAATMRSGYPFKYALWKDGRSVVLDAAPVF